MTLEQQWCDDLLCSDFQKVGTGNVQIFSHQDRRYYCTTCWHTWSFDKGTAFETLRSSRVAVANTLSELGERASLRATARLKHHPVNTVLDWLDIAGAHTAAVSAHLIRRLHMDYVQVDELWTFVKKNKSIWFPLIPPITAICGSGVPWRCPVAYGWSVI